MAAKTANKTPAPGTKVNFPDFYYLLSDAAWSSTCGFGTRQEAETFERELLDKASCVVQTRIVMDDNALWSVRWREIEHVAPLTGEVG